mmetsp:Transcript_27917/g.88782  ORF Transcript_27917/g.88782 Transcript_27917/m.88782 type:complete len:268 (+) Transcript_27917:806-1609(+)
MVEEPGRDAGVEDGRADDVVAVPVAAALRLGGSKHVDEDRGLERGQLRADAPRALVVAKHPQVVCAALAGPEGVRLLDVLQRRLVHSHAGWQEVAEAPVELPHAGRDVHRHKEVVGPLRVEHAVGGAEGAAVNDHVLAPQVHVLPPPVAACLQPAAEAARQLVHIQLRRARRPLAVLRADGRRQRRRRRGGWRLRRLKYIRQVRHEIKDGLVGDFGDVLLLPERCDFLHPGGCPNHLSSLLQSRLPLVRNEVGKGARPDGRVATGRG